MAKYAEVTHEGHVVTFYSDDIHSDIPTDAVPITEEKWQEIIDSDSSKVRWTYNATSNKFESHLLVMSVEQMKERGMSEVAQTSTSYRREILGTVQPGVDNEKPAADTLEFLMALMWKIDDSIPEEEARIPAIHDLANVARQGFTEAATFNSEDPSVLRDRIIEDFGRKFSASAIVSAMQRRAEKLMNEVTSEQEFDNAVGALRVSENDAATKVAQILS